MLKNVEADVARGMLYDLPAVCESETVMVADALGRVVAEDVFAKIPVPPFDRSPFDGYAFRGEDTVGATRDDPVRLKITEVIPAGVVPKFDIKPGHAAKIMTGAPIPRGANATIKFELTEELDGEVRIFEQIPPDTDIVYAGSDIKPGTRIAEGGAIVTPPVISSLANQGFTYVRVCKKPVITVISTGTELAEAGTELRPATIYNSNVHTISAYLAGVGALPRDGGVAPDLPEVIADKIGAALEESDMVITTGGASVGDYDWAVTSAERLGADVLFWKAAMKPGGAIVAAVRDGKVIVSLSGNPAAAVIGLLTVAMPYIKKLCGRRECFFPEVDVKLKEPFLKAGGDKLRILRGRLEIIDAEAYFTAENLGQESEKISTLTGCDLLGILPRGQGPLGRGAIIKAYRV